MRIFVTGAAGFIGFHLARLLLDEGHEVHGYDGMTDYYDVGLKQRRVALLEQDPRFRTTGAMLEDDGALEKALAALQPDIVVHLAAQAGVRYSLTNPKAYIDSNLVGTFNVIEGARRHQVSHLLIASTSSVYGANEKMPLAETDKADSQLTIYAATKKANESMAHAYAHLWDLPTTMFRFFTVYGPWGRPDMAPSRFVDGILKGQPIDIYNDGEMWRDFTYVEDLVRGIRLLMDVPPARPSSSDAIEPGDSLSAAAPFRVVNIGNSDKIRLLDFIDAIESELGLPAIRNYLPMQKGDVLATWADTSLLRRLTGYAPQTNFRDGIRQFVGWYREYHHI